MGAILPETRAPPVDQAPAEGATLISALALYAVVSALPSPQGVVSAALVVIYIDSYASAQVIATRGPNHSLTNQLVRASWVLAARAPLSFRLGKVSSSSNPRDAPSRDGPPMAKIASDRKSRVKDISPLLSLDVERGRKGTLGK